jgi:hypothetical protein
LGTRGPILIRVAAERIRSELFATKRKRTQSALAVYETGSQAVPRGAKPIRAIFELAL